jgi:hypothetical protein
LDASTINSTDLVTALENAPLFISQRSKYCTQAARRHPTNTYQDGE